MVARTEKEAQIMLSIRNRHYRSEESRILPWGDPYILQLFDQVMCQPHLAQRDASVTTYRVGYRRIRIEAHPPLGDRGLDFDIPRRLGEDLPGDEGGDGE